MLITIFSPLESLSKLLPFPLLHLQTSLVNSSNEFMRSLDGIIILSRTLPQLPPGNPGMLNLRGWIEPPSAVLLHWGGGQRKSLQAEQKPFRAPYFWVPGAEMYMPIWYQPNTSRKCQICSARTARTARTRSVNLPRQDVSGSQYAAHKLGIAHAGTRSTFTASTQWSVPQHMGVKSTQYS